MNLVEKVQAQVVGSIDNPLSNTGYGSGLTGFGDLMTNILRLIFVAGGIFALFNFIIAGFQYMNAGGDAKLLEKAWARIWQSLLGLTIMVGSFAIAALVGQLLFDNPLFMLQPKIYGPNDL